jgi:hypothetical protein
VRNLGSTSPDAVRSDGSTAQRGQKPLRVCVVAVGAHGIGGMQRHTHDLVRGLVAAGHGTEVSWAAARTGLKLGQCTPRRLRKEYTVERMIERTVDVYRIAVARAQRQEAA